MKRIITVGLALVLLACLTSALAGTAGTSSDPLISKTYIDTTYNNTVISAGTQEIDEGLQAVLDNAAGKLGTASGTQPVMEYAAGYDYMAASAGASVTLTTGSSIILTGGTMSVSVSKGTVIDISTAGEVSTGTSLKKNIRYFCAEDTEAVFTASTAAAFAVDGSYMPGAGVSKAITHYADVSGSDWFYDAAVYAYNNKIFRDYSSSHFLPDEYATRAEVVYALWMAVGAPASSTEAGFTDLTEDWYMTAVSWSVENGIINGCENNTFKPNDKMTREQLATVMYRYTSYAGGNVNITSDLSKFTDEGKISDWAYKEMSWANAVGVITGTTKTEMEPQAYTIRSQVATVLMRYVKIGA